MWNSSNNADTLLREWNASSHRLVCSNLFVLIDHQTKCTGNNGANLRTQYYSYSSPNSVKVFGSDKTIEYTQ